MPCIRAHGSRDPVNQSWFQHRLGLEPQSVQKQGSAGPGKCGGGRNHNPGSQSREGMRLTYPFPAQPPAHLLGPPHPPTLRERWVARTERVEISKVFGFHHQGRPQWGGTVLPAETVPQAHPGGRQSGSCAGRRTGRIGPRGRNEPLRPSRKESSAGHQLISGPCGLLPGSKSPSVPPFGPFRVRCEENTGPSSLQSGTPGEH